MIKKSSVLLFFSFLLILSLFSTAKAEETKTKFTHRACTLETKNNLINLHAEQTSFKEILKDLEKKTGIKVKIFDGVNDRKVTINLNNLPVYAIHTLLEKIGLENFAVVYDKALSSKVIYILPKGKDITELIKGKTIIRPAKFADGKNINQIKGHEIATVTRGKNNIPVRYVKDEILLKFHLGVTKEEIEEILKKHKLVLVDDESLSKIGYVKVRIPDGRDVIEVIKEIRKEYKVKVPEPNYIAGVLAITDPLYENQWYVPDIDFDKAWDEIESKNRINIAVIDTGVNAEHPDLKDKILKGYDFVNNDSDASDDHGHGTFVTGIISATANDIGIKGLYNYAEILPVKVMDNSGIGTYENTAKGIIYAVDNGAKVVNLSIGGYAYSFMLQDAVDYALSKGSVVVAAGGNDGIEQAIYPAAYPDVIGVSALGYNGQIWSDSNSGRHIDVSAPGLDIISTGLNDDYVYASGTSASAPMVSALAAMLVSEKPELSSSVIERLIIQTAKDLGDEGGDKVYGSGEIDALASLDQEVKPFHDVAVRSVSVEPMFFEKGKPTFIVANIENTGTYKSEEFDVVLYEIIGEEKKEIERKKAITVIDKLKVIFEWKPEGLKDNIKFEVTVFSEDDTNSSNNSKTTFTFSLKESDGLFVLYKNKPFVHSWVALQAYNILHSGSLKSELNNHLYGGATYDQLFGTVRVWEDQYAVPNSWSTDRKSGSSVFEGTWEEDEDDYGIIPDVSYGATDASLRHFWNPDEGYNYGLDTPITTRNYSNLYQAQYWWDKALSAYSTNSALAYYYLGRVIHMLGDLGIPDHVHTDPHPGNPDDWIAELFGDKDDYSNYEEYTGIFYRDYLGSGLPKNINYLPLNLPSSYVPLSYDTELAKLFYNMAQYTQHFDSSDYNGNNIGYGGGTISMGIPSDNGSKNQAYNAVAYLNEGSDRIDPGTTPTIIWQKYSVLSGYYDFRMLYEGPYVDSTYYVDISRGYGQISYSNGVWDEQNNTLDRLKITYQYRNQTKTDYITNPKDNPYYYSVPDHYVDDQANSIFPENIRYVAALYQLFWAKTHPPTVNAFSVTPSSLPLSNYFTISYSVSDVSGSGLKQVELWRANDINGTPDPDWPGNPIKTTILSGESNYSGSFYDEPDSEGTYWYGIHVVDNAGNWNDEQNSQTGGLPGDYGPIKVTVTSSDITRPKILSHNEGTNPNTNIYVTFSENMDSSTFTNSTITVSGFSSGSHSSTFIFNQSIYELTIDPLTNFSYGETVTVTIGTGVRDLAGNGLAGPYTFSFNIESSPPPPPTSISVSASANHSTTTAYAPITVSGTAIYDTEAPVSSGTATITVGGNEWTAPILNNGSFSQEVNAPGSSQNITVSASDGILTGSTTVYITISGDTPPNNYDLTTDIIVDAWDDGSNVFWNWKDSFRTTDPEVNALTYLYNGSWNNWIGMRWKFYKPDGSQYGQTLDITDACQSGWAWCYRSWGFLIKDNLMATLPGRYTVDFYLDENSGNGWEKKATHYYVVGWDFTENRMAKDVEGPPDYLPITPTNTFYNTDAKALTWANFDLVAQSMDIKWEFYEPNGALYGNPFTYTSQDPQTDPNGPYEWYDGYRVWGWVDINGYAAANKTGDWHVKVYVKNPVNSNYELYYTDYFEIIENPAVSPTVNVSNSPANPIETQPITLNVSVTDNTYLKKVLLNWNDGSNHTCLTQDDIFSSSYSGSCGIGSNFSVGQQIEYWAEAWDSSGNRTESTHKTIIVQPETVSTPDRPSGDAYRQVGQAGTYNTGNSNSSLGNPVEYQFDWGDGSQSVWGNASRSHSWSSEGTYFVKARARSQINTNRESGWSSAFTVVVDSTSPLVDISTNNGNDLSTNQSQITIDGTAYDPNPASGIASVNINTGDINNGTSSNWSFTVVLNEGDNTIIVSVTDNAGNIGSDIIIINYTPQYQLTTLVNPPEGGSVSPDCSGGCLYDSGTPVTLTATENSGYTFDGWSGCDSFSRTICYVTIDSDKNVEAAFTANIIYIEPLGICGGNAPCYSSIQDGIDVAGDGTIIKVAQGTYYENISVTSFNNTSKNFILEGGWGSNFVSRSNDPSLTIIDGGGVGSGFYIYSVFSENIIITIEGFTITNCLAPSDTGGDGGAIYATALSNGSSISLYVINNVVINNTAPQRGGGISVFSNEGSTTLTLINNIIKGNTSTRSGGGIAASSASSLGNTSVILTNNLIVENIAGYHAGGIWLESENSSSTTLISTNNSIARNIATYDGGGIYSYSGFYGSNTSINITVTNDIIWGNSAGGLGGDLYVNQGSGGVSSVTATYSDIGDTYGSYNTDGTNLNIDPLFVDSANGDYHLSPNSPLIDAGTNTNAPLDDFEGDNRPFDGDGDTVATTDIGADEYVEFVTINFDELPDGSTAPSSPEVIDDEYSIWGVTFSGGDTSSPNFISMEMLPYDWPASGQYAKDGVSPFKIQLDFSRVIYGITAKVSTATGYTVRLLAYDDSDSEIGQDSGAPPQEGYSQYAGILSVFSNTPIGRAVFKPDAANVGVSIEDLILYYTPLDSDRDGIPDGDGTNPCTGGNTTNCDDNCIDTPNPNQEDFDSDGVGDVCDNCREVSNPDQRDSNSAEDDNLSIAGEQHYGNVCDPDFDNDGIVSIWDFNEWRKYAGETVPTCPEDVDLDGDGFCWIQDFNIWRLYYGSPPGPGIGD